MRVLLPLALGAALAACAAGSAGTARPTALTVAYWPDGARLEAPTVWTLRCDPPRGTLPRPARACRRLEEGGARLLAPVPPGAVCTQVYGGPDRARVTGTVLGRRVWVSFSRTDGCQISRWDALSPWLVPRAGAR